MYILISLAKIIKFSRDATLPYVSCCSPLLAILSHARALTNSYLKKQLLDAYLAFEALTDHPYGFFSSIDGYFTLLSCWDGCNKVAANIKINIEKYLQQREQQVSDMDFDVDWLVISMLSPTIFGMRLQFSCNTPVTFCPQNCKSNVIVVPARGRPPRSGDAQAADGQKPMERVRKKKDGLGLAEMSEGMVMNELKVLYRLCFGPLSRAGNGQVVFK